MTNTDIHAERMPTLGQPGDLEILAGLIAARVKDILATPDGWMDRPAVMAYTGFGGTRISTVFASGELHSHRASSQGHPRTKRSVVDAWVAGANPEQQRQVCDCARFHRWKP